MTAKQQFSDQVFVGLNEHSGYATNQKQDCLEIVGFYPMNQRHLFEKGDVGSLVEEV